MYALVEQLELIFGASILNIQVSSDHNAVPAQFQLGQVYSHMSNPVRLVKMTLIQRNNLLSEELPRWNLLNIFDGVTVHAKVTSIMQESSMHVPVVQTVEFVVFDLENFTKDITTYCWNRFSDEFTKRLDKVLEEE